MLDSAHAQVLVTNNALAERLPALPVTILRLDAPTDVPETLPSSVPAVAVHPDNLAYTMFTSGSTGTPKAVVVTHRGVVRLVREPGYVQLDNSDVVLHQASTSFDAATFEIWGALANGARLVVGSPRTASVLELGALLREHAVTTAFLTTGLFHLMVDERLDDLGGLRQLVTGGDVLSPVRARKLLDAFPHCRLVNGYGPTEVTTFTTCHVVTPSAEAGAPVPIGMPIRDTRVCVLDADLEPVPTGVIGRLYAGGGGVARGYLGDAARTAERFVPDPSTVGERLYFTGDLARSLPDGTIVFHGREDQQVKRRGYRIEPAEIEEALRLDPDVRDAAVVAAGDTADERLLVGHLALRAPAHGGDHLLSAVRKRLGARLPDYLVPDRWVVSENLPLTANGKVDRRALAELPVGRPSLVDTDVTSDEPGEIEAVIAAVWREIFAIDRVSLDDDFFDLGGHSLLASRMIVRIHDRLGVELSLETVFDHSTVAQIAEQVEKARVT
ncbi:non-ribosomal peptide synthetase [Rhodococcus opacus]|nr:non-ribosomal peptide synthetase [Rhodococcus opacus]